MRKFLGLVLIAALILPSLPAAAPQDAATILDQSFGFLDIDNSPTPLTLVASTSQVTATDLPPYARVALWCSADSYFHMGTSAATASASHLPLSAKTWFVTKMGNSSPANGTQYLRVAFFSTTTPVCMAVLLR